MIDLTWPVSIAVFFAGLIAVLLVGLPRYRVAKILLERTGRLSGDAKKYGETLEALQKELKEHDRRMGSLQNQVAAKNLGR